MSWLGLAYGRAGRPRHTSSLNPGRASDAGPILTQPSPLADVEDERIVKRGTRVMRCANPRPTPIGSSTRCATAAFRGRPYRFPNSPRQVVVPASDVLGCPVHRVQALELGPDELVAVGRDAECFTLKPTPCSGTASAGCCSTGTSLSSADLRQPSATPNLVPNHCDSLGRPGGRGRGSQPAGGSPQPP